MKKAITFLTVLLMTLGSAFAQEAGEMSVGGNLGFTFGTSNAKTTFKLDNLNQSNTIKYPSGSFELAPVFGVFVIDNLQFNAGISYEHQHTREYEDDDKTKLTTGQHVYTLGAGLNYYVPITEHFFYTPGFYVDFGGVTDYTKTKSDGSKQKISTGGITTGLEFQLAKFEMKVRHNFAITVSLMDLDYDFYSTSRKKDKSSVSVQTNDTYLKMSNKIGCKYYF